ncbi:MAG: hypothetical protein VX338_05825 [Acidobacteriota bacterium]|nr:hypothetical protein [Acidobacteriota bacterium]
MTGVRASGPHRKGMHVDELTKFSQLFHRLNNQLGIILANAELLEAKATDEKSRTRAAQIVMGVIKALSTAKAIRSNLKTPE